MVSHLDEQSYFLITAHLNSYQRKSTIEINLIWKNGLFIYKIQLVAGFRLYELFRVAFLKYEIVDRIHIFMRKSSHSFQQILEEIKFKEFSLLGISNKSYRSSFDCLVVSNCTILDWFVDSLSSPVWFELWVLCV